MRKFWPTVEFADIEFAGCYYFGGHIVISNKLYGWQLFLTLVHEFSHWLLDCFHASYYTQISFDVLSELWFPNGGKRSREFIRHDRAQLKALRVLGFEKLHFRELQAGQKYNQFILLLSKQQKLP
jgi:hypothetical protein